jgi:selT/selW/selH-like putative selenoprotein
MVDQKTAGFIFFAVILTLTFKDLWYNGRQGEEEDNQEDWKTSSSSNKKIPHTNLNHILTGPTVKVLYCHSCGYRKAFEEYSQILSEKYPDLTIIGDNYPPPPVKAVVVQFVSLLKMAIIFCIIANINPFALLGRPTPGFWTWISNSKIYGCLMTFFIANTIEGQLVASGAFEFYYNDLPIWSKIDTGRIPTPAELFQIIDNHMLNQAASFAY